MTNQDKTENNNAAWAFGLLVSCGATLIIGYAAGAFTSGYFPKKEAHPIENLHTFIPRYRILTNDAGYGLECQVPINPEGADKWMPVKWQSKERDAAVAEIASRTRLVVDLWPSTLRVFEIESEKMKK